MMWKLWIMKCIDKLGFGGKRKHAANGLIRHDLRRATFPRGGRF